MRITRSAASALTLAILGFWTMMSAATTTALTAQGAEAAAPQQAAEIGVAEKMVSVGPVRLYFKVYYGGGAVSAPTAPAAPTVVLESGGGMDSTQWAAFAPALAKTTGATVVTYDRAGFGKSDLPETPYDLAQETGWLFTALAELGLDKNLILAGHSYGGLLIRHEAATRAGAVRGLVFIDPFTVDFVDLLGLDFCNNMEGLNKLPNVSPEEYVKMEKQQKADLRMGGYPDGGNLAKKCELIRPLAVPAGIPVRIVTSGRTWMPEEMMKAWRQAHERFSTSMPGAKLVVAAESDHMIPERQPDLLVSVLAEVIAEAKAAKR